VIPPASGTAIVGSPLGPVRLLALDGALSGLYFVGQRDDPQGIDEPGQLDAATQAAADLELLARARLQLDDYFARRLCRFDLPLALHGTPFQRAVWQALLDIAHGHVRSYGEVARYCGRPTAVRAVGRAVGSNPVSIVVPCHRVIGADGALTGFGGGLSRKQALLRLEGALPPGLEGFD
jgi:methylated-DNA-[protein]-cysteine S-methyltransferase